MYATNYFPADVQALQFINNAIKEDSSSEGRSPTARNDDDLFVCNIDGCGKKFKHKSNMTRHKLAHSGVKPFVCFLCGKGYSRKADMVIHQIHIHDMSKRTAEEHHRNHNNQDRKKQQKRKYMEPSCPSVIATAIATAIATTNTTTSPATVTLETARKRMRPTTAVPEGGTTDEKWRNKRPASVVIPPSPPLSYAPPAEFSKSGGGKISPLVGRLAPSYSRPSGVADWTPSYITAGADPNPSSSSAASSITPPPPSTRRTSSSLFMSTSAYCSTPTSASTQLPANILPGISSIGSMLNSDDTSKSNGKKIRSPWDACFEDGKGDIGIDLDWDDGELRLPRVPAF